MRGAAAGGGGPPEEQPAPASRDAAAAASQPQIEPERFSQLATTVSYLEAKLEGNEFVTLPVADVCHDLGLDRGSWSRSCPCCS